MVKKKAGRLKGSKTTKKSDKVLIEKLFEDNVKLTEENRALIEEATEDVELQEDIDQKTMDAVSNMQSFQHKALDYLFVLVLVLSIFNFLG